MPYYIIAVTIAHKFPVATELETLSAARNSAKILLELPGSIIEYITIKDMRHDCDYAETIQRPLSPNAEAEGASE